MATVLLAVFIIVAGALIWIAYRGLVVNYGPKIK